MTDPDELSRAIEIAQRQVELVKTDDRLLSLREKYKSLSEFMRGAWHVIEPRRQLVWGWHIDCILEHLEAVHRQEIQYLLINIPPAHIKPVDEETPVLLADGLAVPLREVQAGDLVITHLGRRRRVLQVAEQGELPTVEIVTHQGRVIRAAADHPFLTPNGWKNAGELRVGECLAVVVPEDSASATMPRQIEEYRLAGYIIGDGNVTKNGAGKAINANITCFDEEQKADVIACIEALGFGYSLLGGASRYAGRRIDLKGGAREWLRANGMAKCTSWTKRVPGFVWTAPKACAAEFVGAYFACDGTLNQKGHARQDLCISFGSVNRPLLEDVQRLLARFGIPARIREHRQKFNAFTNGPYSSWHLDITGADAVARFVEQIPVRGAKAARLLAWEPKRERFDERLMPDRIVSIGDGGVRRCRCLSVEDDRSFTANGVAVHNTTLANIIFPAWRWAGGEMPEARTLAGSYSMPMAKKSAEKSRVIVMSKWYREFWPEIELKRASNSVSRFENTLGGGRYCFSTGGPLTGDHCDTAMWDDPLKASDAMSPRAREKAIEYLEESIPSRLIDQLTGAIIIIMQRLHEKDPAGHMLTAEYPDLVHVCLPCHFDPDRACKTRWFRDPRKERGTLLWPERFGEPAIRKLTARMTERAVNAQLEQRPNVPGGQFIKRADWLIWPQRDLPRLERVGIVFDAAMSDGDDTSYWACQIWGVFTPSDCWDPSEGEPPVGLPEVRCLLLLGAWHERCRYTKAKGLLLEAIKFWSDPTPVDDVIIEEKANGITLADELEEAGCPGLIRFNPGTKSKTERVDLASDFWSSGRIWVLGRKFQDNTRSATRWPKWVETVVAECEMFPVGEVDDFVDCCSMAVLFYRAEREITADTDVEDETPPIDQFEQKRGPIYA